jgi:orotate phosphoribosyltransferase
MKSFSIAERLPVPMRDTLRDLLADRALRVAKSGEWFTLSTGRQSKFYFNCKPVTLSSDGLPLVADAFWEKLKLLPDQPTAVGGRSIGADPIVCAMTMRSIDRGQALEGFLVRESQKAHGTKELIANVPRAGTKVVIVDDVVTTGTSTIDAIKAAREARCIVVGVIVLMDRGEQGGADNIRQYVPSYHAIFTRHDFPEIGETDDCPTTNSDQLSSRVAST